MTRAQRTLDLALALQRLPRTFAQIRERYPRASERTCYRMLRDIREVADLNIDRGGRYSVAIVFYDNGEERMIV